MTHTSECTVPYIEKGSRMGDESSAQDVTKTMSKERSFRVKEKGGGLSRGYSAKDKKSMQTKKTAIPAETDPSKRFTGTWESDSGEGMDLFLKEL